MHVTTANTGIRAPRPRTTGHRMRTTAPPAGKTDRCAVDVLTRHDHAGVDEWARRAQSANGFGDGALHGTEDDEAIGPARIREAAERNAKLLALKPDKGHLTGVTKATIERGLCCVIEEGPWKLRADMPAKAGGGETAPTPGMLGRGALASCLAIGITVWAARLEIPLITIEVEVQADFDARGELGVGDGVPPGYEEVRYLVSIESPASDAALAELVRIAERHSPYLDVFARGQAMRATVRANGKEI